MNTTARLRFLSDAPEDLVIEPDLRIIDPRMPPICNCLACLERPKAWNPSLLKSRVTSRRLEKIGSQSEGLRT